MKAGIFNPINRLLFSPIPLKRRRNYNLIGIPITD